MGGYSSPEESYELMTLVTIPENEQAVKSLMDAYLETAVFSNGLDNLKQQQVVNKILQQEILQQEILDQESLHKESIHAETLHHNAIRQDTLQHHNTKQPFQWPGRLFAAAAVLFILAIPVYLYYDHTEQRNPVYTRYKGEVPAGSNKATLTLDDGKKLQLTGAKNGVLATQQGMKISKEADGRVVYEMMEQTPIVPAVHYNTISTPAGGQYQVVLPDGSRVWLNSLSSITYPISFVNLSERKVHLTGEAYFEVARRRTGNRFMPFIVTTPAQQVEVLGTHFNISAYAEEPQTRTTLLEGTIAVSRKGNFREILHPGEQSRVNTSMEISQADTTTAVAWKNGFFKFENAGITSVMQQFSRWYDVDVAYQGAVPANRFIGELYRDMSLRSALQLLTLAKINYHIEAPANPRYRKRVVIHGKK